MVLVLQRNIKYSGSRFIQGIYIPWIKSVINTMKIIIISLIGFISGIALGFLLSSEFPFGTSVGRGGGGTSIGNGGFDSLLVSHGGSGVGTISTTTSTFGDTSTSTSAACFNMKTNLGATTSVYVVGTVLVVEAGNCK